jgi:hypothetical protein
MDALMEDEQLCLKQHGSPVIMMELLRARLYSDLPKWLHGCYTLAARKKIIR